MIVAIPIQSFVYDAPTTTSNRETFCQTILEIWKYSFPKFLENIEEMFPRYYIHSDVLDKLSFLTTP